MLQPLAFGNSVTIRSTSGYASYLSSYVKPEYSHSKRPSVSGAAIYVSLPEFQSGSDVINIPPRRANPIVTHRLSRSMSVGPALISRPAAMRSSPMMMGLANHDPAMMPAHSVRMSWRPWGQLAQLSDERVQLGTLARAVEPRRGASMRRSGPWLTCRPAYRMCVRYDYALAAAVRASSSALSSI